MATRRNDFLTGLQVAQGLLGPLAQAMGQWRDDRIANELMQTASAPRAQAVDPTLQPAADARAAAMPIPIPQGSGSKGLQMRMQLDKAMQDRQLRGAQLKNLEARTAAAGKPRTSGAERPPGYWESQMERNQGNPRMAQYKQELGQFHKERSKLEGTIGIYQDSLAAKLGGITQTPIEELLPLKGAYRANEKGYTDEQRGKFARLRGANDELVSMPWDHYQKLLKGHAALESMKKRLAGMAPPELPVFEKGSDGSGKSVGSQAGADQTAQARQWAKAHPNDPRAAEILRRLGE